MIKKNIFDNLYVLDIANNHFGNLQHGKNIINAFSKIIKRHKINATFKFQFRNLDTFISKSAAKSNNAYIDRFLSTKLTDENYYKLMRLIKKNKVLTSCTPFDEESVTKIEKMKFDIIKIASVSANEWPLLERVSKNKIPKIISTGGLSLEEIDEIVSFFRHRNNQFALMHCVSIYPTKNDDLQLNVIKDLKKRYKDFTIGWSTHESPDQILPRPLAYACGARMFEKHINIKSKKYSINKYSIEPEQYNLWLEEILNSEKMLGNTKKTIKKDLHTPLGTVWHYFGARLALTGRFCIKFDTIWHHLALFWHHLIRCCIISIAQAFHNRACSARPPARPRAPQAPRPPTATCVTQKGIATLTCR